MTKLADIFQKPIDRPIEGVIKADDQRHLRTEVEEYVLTNEVQQQLENLLEVYTQPRRLTTANGVWISGFFGSGKSHLLKMLALLLANREVEGQSVLDAFLEKAAENPILQGLMRKAAAIQAQSILFNIDQKADVINKKSEDALLAVFVKVFNEERGYYGKQGHIATFERDLDRRGLYEDFKRAYREISGKDWERGREESILEARNIDRAYARVMGEDESYARDIIRQYRTDYKVSIEDFAREVNEYIQTRGPDFRLTFFVDEVGQYIAGNIRLMTNLQTIAESLATKCRGRAWIMVTAQEEMDQVIGEMRNRQQGLDFSKIQDRFRIRIKLTSKNVSEVIRKRLLMKNDEGRRLLHVLYEREKNNLGTLFQFPEGGQKYRNFRDEEDFIDNYPFIPYQFTLFQSAIISFSQHDAFEGRHRSVGERSMLDVFRRVALQIADEEVGRLATFDLMYEGIRATVKAQFQRSILNAEQHLGDPVAVQVLKALFLVKYVKEFRATPGNIAVLMLDRFDVDILALRKRVEAALVLLEQQVYVQRNGDEYEYLTDEEKDIEREIKNTEVDTRDIIEELNRIVFDQIIRERKIHYPETGQHYAFSRKLDDQLFGRDHELAIHVISPFYENADQVDALRAQSMLRDELLVVMPNDDRLVADMLMYERTEKYVQQNLRSTQQASVQEILHRKRAQNVERRNAIKAQVAEGLAQARLFAGGEELLVGSEDAKTRIIQGFYELIARTYPNLVMLRGASYSEEMIAEALNAPESLFGDDEAGMSEAELEVLNFIRSEEQRGLRPTMLSVVNKFTRSPYGWDRAAVQVMTAKLIARGKVEAQATGETLEDEALLEALKNTHRFQSLILIPQIEFSARDVRQLKDFYGDFFNQQPPAAADARIMARLISEGFKELANKLHELWQQRGEYPFLAVLEEPLAKAEQLIGKRPGAYLDALRRGENALYEMKEQIIDPVSAFMRGRRREIYDDARRFLQQNRANLDYIDGEEARRLQAILDDPTCFQGDTMREARQLQEALGAKIQARLTEEKRKTKASLEQKLDQLTAMPQFAKLTPEQREMLRRPFEEHARFIDSQTLIPSIRDAVNRFEETSYNRVLSQFDDWTKPEQIRPEPHPKGFRERQIVPLRSVSVVFDKIWLEDETDVDAYLAALRKALMQAIGEGRRVRL